MNVYRVLFFIHIIDNQLFDQVKALLEADPDLEIVLAPRGGIDETQWVASGIEAMAPRIHIHQPSLYGSRLRLWQYAPQVVYMCLRDRVQLIDTHMGQTLESRATYLATRLIRLPYTVSMYGKERNYSSANAMSPGARRWLERVLRSASLLLCHDKTLLETARQIVGERVPKYLLYNAVDPDRSCGHFNRSYLRQKYGIPQGRKVVLYNHRIMAFKRPLVYVNAMPLIHQQCPNICFLFVGPRRLDSELGKEIQHRIAKQGLQANVVWIDRRVSGLEMDEVYAISDVLVNVAELIVPSLTTLEAMSFGIPLVIAAELDSELYVQHGENGFIVPPEPVVVADAVVRILQDGELRRRMGEAGRKRASRYFDIRDWGKRITQCYRHVLFNEPLPPPQRFQ